MIFFFWLQVVSIDIFVSYEKYWKITFIHCFSQGDAPRVGTFKDPKELVKLRGSPYPWTYLNENIPYLFKKVGYHNIIYNILLFFLLKGQFLLENLVDTKKEYNFDSVLNSHFDRKKTLSLLRKNADDSTETTTKQKNRTSKGILAFIIIIQVQI